MLRGQNSAGPRWSQARGRPAGGDRSRWQAAGVPSGDFAGRRRRPSPAPGAQILNPDAILPIDRPRRSSVRTAPTTTSAGAGWSGGARTAAGTGRRPSRLAAAGACTRSAVLYVWRSARLGLLLLLGLNGVSRRACLGLILVAVGGGGGRPVRQHPLHAALPQHGLEGCARAHGPRGAAQPLWPPRGGVDPRAVWVMALAGARPRRPADRARELTGASRRSPPLTAAKSRPRSGPSRTDRWAGCAGSGPNLFSALSGEPMYAVIKTGGKQYRVAKNDV